MPGNTGIVFSKRLASLRSFDKCGYHVPITYIKIYIFISSENSPVDFHSSLLCTCAGDGDMDFVHQF